MRSFILSYWFFAWMGWTIASCSPPIYPTDCQPISADPSTTPSNAGCCKALEACCPAIKDETARKDCEKRVSDTAPLACQALYQELHTNNKC